MILNLELFNKKQKKQIQLGFDNGLTEEQVLLYANAEYCWTEMLFIRKLLENFNYSDVYNFMNSEFWEETINDYRLAVKEVANFVIDITHKLSIPDLNMEKIHLYAGGEFKYPLNFDFAYEKMIMERFVKNENFKKKFYSVKLKNVFSNLASKEKAKNQISVDKFKIK